MAVRPSAPLQRLQGAAYPWPLYALWAAVAVTIPIWLSVDTSAWDVRVYWNAIQALRAGHDPYSSAMAIQTAVHLNGGVAAGADPPYSYVYSPITLPLLRLIALVPGVVSGTLYWALYCVAVLVQIWAAMQAVEPEERACFLYLAPVAAFFPGLLANGILLGGNVAYILYALVFATAVMAWRGHSWRWFYFAVLVASCVKAPLLCLVVLPVLTARKQWVPTIATAAAGMFSFGMQRFIWPDLFKHYLQAVALQFTYNRDFGCSPAGLLSGFLYDRGIDYTVPASVFYATYALAILGTLFYLSRLYLRGLYSLQQWLPVLMVGVILLNPRLIEYDVAPLALPLAFIGWRWLRSFLNRVPAAWIAAVIFGVLNTLAVMSWSLRKVMDGPLLVVFFVAGSFTLLRKARGQQAVEAGSMHVVPVVA
jgi:hypothetical protein